jgi:hypothetical protein
MSRAKEMSKSQIANSRRDRDTTNGSSPDHVLVCGWCLCSTTITSLRVMGTGRASLLHPALRRRLRCMCA